MRLPKGYGYPLRASDGLLLNHMIHNLTPVPTQVYMSTRSTSCRRARARRAGCARCGRSGWTCRAAASIPVFNVRKGSGRNGRFTYPDDSQEPVSRRAEEEPVGRGQAGRARGDGGPPPPGRALHGPEACAAGRKDERALFRSRARSTSSRRGAVSWDVAMTGTPADWRVKVRKGDVLSVSATYDTTRGVLVGVDGDHGRLSWRTAGRAKNPFKTQGGQAAACSTHGHLPENDNHGGGPTNAARPAPAARRAREPGLRRPRQLPVPARRPEPRRAGAQPAGDTAGPDADVPRRRRRREGDLPLDHLVQAALQPLRPGSPTRSRTATCSSSPARWAAPARRRRARSSGRRRPTSRPAPTRTSAGSTRSCAGPSGSSSSVREGRAVPARSDAVDRLYAPVA